MFNHVPAGYVCPFCEYLAGKDDEYGNRQDIVYANEFATAFIGSRWWINNPGSVLVIPNHHAENIYDVSDEDIAETYKVVKKLAIAIRSTYDCEGTSTRQHNEPAGDQDMGHFHVHVFPRNKDDGLYKNHDNALFADTAARAPYAEKLRAYFASSAA